MTSAIRAVPSKEICVNSSAIPDVAPKRKRSKRFNLHNFLTRVELAALRIAATILLLFFLYQVVIHALLR